MVKSKGKSKAKKHIDAIDSIKNLEELEREYHITEEHITLKLVLIKILEKLESYIKILVQILQPEEFHSLQECAGFDDKRKAELFDIYKSMMILHREIIKSEISGEDNEMLSTIAYAHSEMLGYKKYMLDVLSKMQESWKKTGTKHNIGYFG